MIGSKSSPRGFALLVAIVLSGVALAITVALTTIAYKGLLLASAAEQSQYAFYAADTALECALYWDNGQRNNGVSEFPFQGTITTPSVQIQCPTDNITLTAGQYKGGNATTTYQSGWFAVNDASCARITIYKDKNGHANLYGDDTNVACQNANGPVDDPRAVERGLKATY